ncbi:serine/threonine protein kinase [Brevibacillus ruminantium]|uniref:Serine/threonine protein kinase n=1 Tax=Brevibacillus ruminantium TaxID=2950604 RepID=A0ABY4WLR0_9BACL|nr:serine/threonine protein kinase [Brevibacillus ruminantium]USG67604.1 serine/threonine protein kinase [Brevibacillus ruminantium]
MKIPQHVIESFLKAVKVESLSPHNPVLVRATPYPWEVVGVGNYAAVFGHPDYPEVVIKLYAPGRPGWEQEVEVYHKLGESRFFPVCYQSEPGYLVLKRMRGISLFDCFRYGIPIPPQVMDDVESALEEARAKGLFPHDVHGKNVLMDHGRGYLIDVSDYYKNKPDSKWRDLSMAYHRFYLPFIKDRGWKLPLWLLEVIRKGYRFYKKLTRRLRG